MGNSDSALLASDISEGCIFGGIWIGLSVYGYLFLDDFLPRGEKSNSIPYLRTFILIMAGAFFIDGFWAAIMGTGNESVGTILTGEGSAEFVRGLRVRDIRWVSLSMSTMLVSTAISGYNMLGPAEVLGFLATIFVYGMSGFITLRSGSLYTMLFLTIVGFSVVIAGSIVLFFLSRIRTFFWSLRSLIYVFYFGWLLTNWVILIINCPVVQGFGDVAPQYVYWGTTLLALLAITILLRMTIASRKPKYGDQSSVSGKGIVSGDFAYDMLNLSVPAQSQIMPNSSRFMIQ